jgi:hypothetical protein
MAPAAQFLSLAPTAHAGVKPVTVEGAAAPIEIPVAEKTSRSSSTTTNDSVVTPRGSVDESAVDVSKTQFLKLGN